MDLGSLPQNFLAHVAMQAEAFHHSLWFGMLILLEIILGSFLIGHMVLRFLSAGQGRLRRAVPFFLFTAFVSLPLWVADENALFLFFCMLPVFWLGYQGPWYAKLIIGGVFYSLLTPICILVDTAIYTNWNTLFGFGVKVLLFGLLYLPVRLAIPPGEGVRLPPKLWGLMGGLSIAPLFSTLSFAIAAAFWRSNTEYDAFQDAAKSISYTTLPFISFSALALLFALVVLSRHEILEQGQKLAEIQGAYYQGLQREQREVRLLRHDLHNHITATQGLLLEGDVAGAKQYLDALSQSPALTGGKRYCENDIANAILSGKAATMEQEGISMDMEVNLPQSLPIADVELCALLGNALDNAIEASRTASEKQVSVRARADRGMLMLRVENTIGQTPRQEGNAFITTKKDRTQHGFGLAGMQEIAKKYGGSLEAASKDGRFELIGYVPFASR